MLGIFFTGLVAVYGIFDKKMKNRIKEAGDLDEKVRTLYREESDAQAKKISELTSKMAELEKSMEKIISENKIMKEIFQGRDGQTLEFQKQGFEAIKTAAEIKSMVLEQRTISLQNKDGILNVNKNVERLAKAIEKHLQSIEKQGGE
jgi:glutamine synthetase type III